MEELNLIEDISNELGEIVSFIDEAERSWYTFGKEDISILPKDNKPGSRKTKQLSAISSVVKGLNSVRQRRIYVPLERKQEAKDRLEKFLGGV